MWNLSYTWMRAFGWREYFLMTTPRIPQLLLPQWVTFVSCQPPQMIFPCCDFMLVPPLPHPYHLCAEKRKVPTSLCMNFWKRNPVIDASLSNAMPLHFDLENQDRVTKWITRIYSHTLKQDSLQAGCHPSLWKVPWDSEKLWNSFHVLSGENDEFSKAVQSILRWIYCYSKWWLI